MTTDFSMTTEQYIEDLKTMNERYDDSMIIKAFEIANRLHNGQMRKSGEPYIIHPIAVSKILASFGMDNETVVAGLLHDVVEDTEYTREELVEDFNEEIALLVDGVTKLGNIKYDSKEELQAENFRKMFLAMSKDIRVLIIKLADRLHNMRTMEFMPPHKRKEKSAETLEIYAPLAGRLGIYSIKFELEDLAFKYLHPEDYESLSVQVSKRKEEREKIVDQLIDEISDELDKANFHYDVMGRSKHLYSIYKKMTLQHKQLDEIFDLIAIRVIVNTVKDCYAVLGLVHTKWTPIPGRFKDYIAMPKPNMYQSLHTTLIGPDGQPFEIQIRTYEMHRTSEYGIAAHWKYKEASNGNNVENQEEEKLSWLRQILEWQKDMSDNREFMSLLKSDLDLFSDTVFCFTPSGDVKNLPTGSTPIDFAYSIHSAVGNKMIGAKVNGKLVTIDYRIQNGDRIEIITSQNSHGPSRDWLNIVKSTQAKNKINQWFRSEFKEENIAKGKELIAQYCKMKGIELADINKPEYQSKILRKYGFHDWDSALASVGHGGLKEGQVVNKMLEEYKKDHVVPVTDKDVLENVQESTAKMIQPKSKSGIVVKGLYDVAVHFSKCCSPVPGDEIVGFVTRGRGVSIHRTDCINIMNLSDIDRARLIDAEWQHGANEGSNGLYLAEIKIFGNNRTGLLVDITRIFTERGIDINAINSKTSKQGIATIALSFSTKGKTELLSLIDKIRQVEGVIDIERTTG